MFVLDTNVLIYASDEASPDHVRCRALVEKARGSPSAWYLTWGIAYEFLRVVTHPNVMKRPWKFDRAWLFIESLLESPGCGLLQETERHPLIVREVMGLVPFLAGNLVHDAHTAVLMKEHGIRRIYTSDSAFQRFPFLEAVNPARP